ncbi:MAG: tetratricopeptide repeat protein, partial [Planctomyces sp.]
SARWNLDYLQKLQAASSQRVAELLRLDNECSKRLAAQDHAAAVDGIAMLLPLEFEILGADHPYVANSYASLQAIHLHLQQYSEMQAAATKALAIRQKHLGRQHPLTAQMEHAVGQSLAFEGQDEPAIPYFQRASAAFRDARLAGNAADSLHLLGDSFAILKRKSEALQAYEAALAELSKDNQHKTHP